MENNYIKGLKLEILAELARINPKGLMDIMDASIKVEHKIIILWHVWWKHLPRQSRQDLCITSKKFDLTPFKQEELDNRTTTYIYVGDLDKKSGVPPLERRDERNCHCILFIDVEYQNKRAKRLYFHCDENFGLGNHYKK